jgi:hypothetical protein
MNERGDSGEKERADWMTKRKEGRRRGGKGRKE